MLRTNKTHIIDRNGKTLQLRGVNLGGWLMMEAYILHAPNYAEQGFKREFAVKNGKAALKEFENSFRNAFIREADFKKIVDLNFNCVRLPFNHRLVETRPFHYYPQGLKYLD